MGSNRHDSRKIDDPSGALARLRPFAEKARTFTGWDLSTMGTHLAGPGPTWDYSGILRDLAPLHRAALDLGTGGGEFLTSLAPALPRALVATESWSVNAPIAYRRLSPMGVRVVQAQSTRLPFRSSSFDLILDRNEEFSPPEVDRVLTPGGHFVTEQVGHHNWPELRRHFPRMAELGDQRSAFMAWFGDRGFVVESREDELAVAYPGLGEIVFMLLIAPWEIPEFSLEDDLKSLLDFEAECLTEDGLVVTECRYIIVAQKPA